MDNALVTSPLGILATLAGVTSFFFLLEKRTGWKLFDLFPPLLFIYAVPLLMSNTGARFMLMPMARSSSAPKAAAR